MGLSKVPVCSLHSDFEDQWHTKVREHASPNPLPYHPCAVRIGDSHWSFDHSHTWALIHFQIQVDRGFLWSHLAQQVRHVSGSECLQRTPLERHLTSANKIIRCTCHLGKGEQVHSGGGNRGRGGEDQSWPWRGPVKCLLSTGQAVP